MWLFKIYAMSSVVSYIDGSYNKKITLLIAPRSDFIEIKKLNVKRCSSTTHLYLFFAVSKKSFV
jgi:hypothetical protein